MATTPPAGATPPSGNPPPGGYPPGRPPYGPQYGPQYGGNPRDYWRFQKEQSRAAWRAQRDAWRAQRDVLRAQNRSLRVPSIAGPIVLIVIGIVALLLMTGRINADQFWSWYGQWWPLMLIGIGVVALAEWAIDLRRDNPPYRRFGSYGGIIILLVFIGIGSAGWHHFWGPIRAQFGDNDNDFFGSFGEPQHQMDQAVVNTQIPANAQISIQVPRGDIAISAEDGDQISIRAHQIAFAGTDEGAKKIFDAEQAHVTVSGNAVLVKVDGNPGGRTNLIITVPKTASVNVTANRGGVTVAGLGGDVDADVPHGDMEATAIHGRVHAHIANHADFSAHDIQGDVTVEGNGSDLTLSDIHGKVSLQGEYGGDIHLERVDQEVLFHSSRTDMGFARLPGDMSMTLDSLHVTQVAGPVHIDTHSKDIEMSQVYGDTRIEDRDGRVELDMAGAYQVEVKDSKGDVEVSLPPGVNQTVEMRTHNGDIVSDFPLQISGDENKTITGNLGSGGPRLVLSTEHADLGLHKGTEAVPLPPLPAPGSTKTPTPATPPKVPHLKPSKGEAAPTPVSQ